MPKKKEIIETDLRSQKVIAKKIFLIRGKRVMLDRDLAELYGVPTKRLNEQVKRNKERFPAEFMIQLTKDEKIELVANCDRFNSLKHSTVLPHAFTEYGALMLTNVIKSLTAIDVSIHIVKTFVKVRELLSAKTDIKRKVALLEQKYQEHDYQIDIILDVIDQLVDSPKKLKKKIGY